jgi:hypothetical protein
VLSCTLCNNDKGHREKGDNNESNRRLLLRKKKKKKDAGGEKVQETFAF